jgi:hypothetical protein
MKNVRYAQKLNIALPLHKEQEPFCIYDILSIREI